MTTERAIEILDPEHREKYDGIEEVNEACRMGMEALKALKLENEDVEKAVANVAGAAASAANDMVEAMKRDALKSGTVVFKTATEMTPAEPGMSNYIRMNICKRAVETWGEKAQILMVIEEMAELTKALLKYFRYGERKDVLDSIQEERADVQIMLEQLHVIFGSCEEQQKLKLKRLAARLKSAREANP